MKINRFLILTLLYLIDTLHIPFGKLPIPLPRPLGHHRQGLDILLDILMGYISKVH